METAQWRRLSQQFEELCDLPSGEREARLADLECDSPALAGELRRMLAADATRRGVLTAGAGALALDLAADAAAAAEAAPQRLAAGARLGPYHVETLLGAGGMGEVYRARDTRLDRAVAVKVLPVALSGSGEPRRRFEREARAISQLQHPHICALFDVGREGERDYLVMELLEGESLAARLRRGALPMEQVLRFGREVAEALDYAHRRGIVHRDLKPANVMITRAGAKLLDFGVARMLAGSSPVAPPALTAEGAILGTVQYMAPEQLEGKECDARTDLFALGSLLYEMATGRPAFEGGSPASLIAAILSAAPPPISTLLKVGPQALDRVVRLCLAKDPEERWQSAHDVAAQLGGIAEASSQASTAPSLERPLRGRFPARWLLPAALGAVLAAAAVWMLAARGAFAPNVSPPRFQQQTFRRGTVSSARFAPDGQTIVYAAAWEGRPYELFATRRGSFEARPLGIGPARILAISAAGEMAILLGGGQRRSEGMLASVPLAGGTPRELLADVREADWLAGRDELAVVRRAGDRDVAEVPLGRVIHEAPTIWSLRVAHDGDRVAFFAGPGPYQGDLYVRDRSGEVRPLSSGWIVGQGLAWSPSDDEIWFSGTRGDREIAVYAVSLSGGERVLAQGPDPLYVQDLFADGVALVGRNDERQNLTCLAPGASEERDLGWFGSSWLRDLSADGRTVLFSEGEAGGGPRGSVYIRATDGSPAIRLGEGLAEGLSPDGTRALVRSRDGRELAVLPTGAGARQPLPLGNLEAVGEGDWLDNHRIVFQGTEKGHAPRVYVEDVEAGTRRPLTPEGVELALKSPTPDRRSVMVFVGDEAFLFPVDGGERRPVPHLAPQDTPLQWSADGRYLFVRLGSSRPPVEIQRLDTVTGERRTWWKLQPRAVVGVPRVHPIVLTLDGRSYCYTYNQELSDLFLVEGLR
jgi:hypothetical protein